MNKVKVKASTLTILKDECFFGPAECRVVRDVDTGKVWCAKRYAILGGKGTEPFVLLN